MRSHFPCTLRTRQKGIRGAINFARRKVSENTYGVQDYERCQQSRVIMIPIDNRFNLELTLCEHQ
jgi:hypothetical protein